MLIRYECSKIKFSHGTHEEHLERINLIKKVRDELKLPIAIMLDTKGPEYRIKTFKEGERFFFLKEKNLFLLQKKKLLVTIQKFLLTIKA